MAQCKAGISGFQLVQRYAVTTLSMTSVANSPSMICAMLTSSHLTHSLPGYSVPQCNSYSIQLQGFMNSTNITTGRQVYAVYVPGIAAKLAVKL